MTTCKKIVTALAALLLLLTCLCLRTFSATAEEVRYTAVLDDLQTDATFRAEDYPADASDSSLQVIQIAESVNGELFVFPFGQSGDVRQHIDGDKRSESEKLCARAA